MTPEVVATAAASEIKTGRRVGLGWDMKKLEYSQFGRQKCDHTIIPLGGPGGSGYGACFDDAYSMNPRMSSISINRSWSDLQGRQRNHVEALIIAILMLLIE